eukprot:m.19586 g.19586  ORF g.19586 m.19586 type:complete len:741 (+) comp3455_c1_seq1:50-2272(+)
MNSAHVLSVRVASVEKRLTPKPHFAYKIDLAWSNGEKTTILRRFKDIYKFHIKLLDLFPVEAGEYEGARRIIPLLPGKKKQGNTKEKSEKVIGELDEYFKGLISLEKKISCCEYVLRFLSMNTGDYKFVDLQRTVQAHADPVTGQILNASEYRERRATLMRMRKDTVSKKTSAEESEGFISQVVAQRDAVDYFKSTRPAPLNNVLTIPNRLPYARGETLFVISMTDCPAGHWQCRNTAGDVGYVPSSDLAIDPTLLKTRMHQILDSKPSDETSSAPKPSPHPSVPPQPAASAPHATTATPSGHPSAPVPHPAHLPPLHEHSPPAAVASPVSSHMPASPAARVAPASLPPVHPPAQPHQPAPALTQPTQPPPTSAAPSAATATQYKLREAPAPPARSSSFAHNLAPAKEESESDGDDMTSSSEDDDDEADPALRRPAPRPPVDEPQASTSTSATPKGRRLNLPPPPPPPPAALMGGPPPPPPLPNLMGPPPAPAAQGRTSGPAPVLKVPGPAPRPSMSGSATALNESQSDSPTPRSNTVPRHVALPNFGRRDSKALAPPPAPSARMSMVRDGPPVPAPRPSVAGPTSPGPQSSLALPAGSGPSVSPTPRVAPSPSPKPPVPTPSPKPPAPAAARPPSVSSSRPASDASDVPEIASSPFAAALASRARQLKQTDSGAVSPSSAAGSDGHRPSITLQGGPEGRRHSADLSVQDQLMQALRTRLKKGAAAITPNGGHEDASSTM